MKCAISHLTCAHWSISISVFLPCTHSQAGFALKTFQYLHMEVTLQEKPKAYGFML